jgi:hypothetical protein
MFGVWVPGRKGEPAEAKQKAAESFRGSPGATMHPHECLPYCARARDYARACAHPCGRLLPGATCLSQISGGARLAEAARTLAAHRSHWLSCHSRNPSNPLSPPPSRPTFDEVTSYLETLMQQPDLLTSSRARMTS